MAAPANEVPLALAFGAGLVATVNPCGFAMLPALLSYYLGSGVSSKAGPGRLAEGLAVGLVMTAGFMVVFGSVGIAFALGARAIVRIVPWLTIVMGIGLAGLGIWLLTGRHVAVRLPGPQRAEASGYRSLFVFGMAYAVGSLSCTLPVFLLVIGSGIAAGSVLGTLGVFLAYALGMSTILMLLCLGTAGFREVIARRVRRLSRYVSRVSGALLVLGGAYVAYYWISLLSGSPDSWAIRFTQALQRSAQDIVTRPGNTLWFFVGVLLAVAAVFSTLRAVRRRRRAVDSQGILDEPDAHFDTAREGEPVAHE